jgi:hypothetical protein
MTNLTQPKPNPVPAILVYGTRRSRREACAGRRPQRTPNVLEVVRRQLRQHVRIDLVVSEIRLVLAEAEAAKPPANVHGRAPPGLQDNHTDPAMCPARG